MAWVLNSPWAGISYGKRALFQGFPITYIFHPSVEQKDVELVRDEARQIGEMKVPKDALNGHAFHTYTVTSPDGSGACSGP